MRRGRRGGVAARGGSERENLVAIACSVLYARCAASAVAARAGDALRYFLLLIQLCSTKSTSTRTSSPRSLILSSSTSLRAIDRYGPFASSPTAAVARPG